MLQKVDLPEISKGPWRIEHFSLSENEAFVHNLRERHRSIPAGEQFTRLVRGGTIVMSDTPAERRDHYSAFRRATGRVLINGLGLGMLLKNILTRNEVTDITVVEISQDLIDLVSPFYSDPRVHYICADALRYTPPKGARYQMVWHDIWDTICADNLTQMQTLHRRYGHRVDWQGSWCRSECEDRRDQNKRRYR